LAMKRDVLKETLKQKYLHLQNCLYGLTSISQRNKVAVCPLKNIFLFYFKKLSNIDI